ncbi:MAG: hypothetical protein ACK5IC_00900 [Moheibacter sp.]
MKSIIKKSASVLIFILAGCLKLNQNMKNEVCKTQNGYELVRDNGMPINIDEKIEKGCECITKYQIINPNPKQFSSEQLKEIRKQLSKWAIKNVNNFSDEDSKNLFLEIDKLSDVELLMKIKYKYSFIEDSGEEVYVFSMKILNTYAYFINYNELYQYYKNKLSRR